MIKGHEQISYCIFKSATGSQTYTKMFKFTHNKRNAYILRYQFSHWLDKSLKVL